MNKTTVARESFLIRLRVHSDSTWAGQVEQIRSGRKETFHDPQQLLERLTAMVDGSEPGTDAAEEPRKEKRQC